MTYYNYENGGYVQSPQGYLPGIEWIDSNNNNFRAVMHTPAFTNLKGKTLQYLYDVECKPVGMTNWLVQKRDVIVTVSDNNYIKLTTGEVVPPSEALDENGQLKPGYAPQFTFFIEACCKGSYGAIPPIYKLMVDEIARRENVPVIA